MSACCNAGAAPSARPDFAGAGAGTLPAARAAGPVSITPGMSLADALMLPSRPIVDPASRLVLLWSAKSGCTFAIRWMLHHMGLLEEAERFDPWVHHFRNRRLFKDPAYRAGVRAFAADPAAFRVVRVVRDPFRRAVSSYRHVVLYGFEDARIARVLGRDLAEAPGLSFREFVTYLESIDIRRCNPHLKAQVHPAEAAGLIRPGFVVHLETSVDTLPVLERHLGLPRPADLRRLRASGHHTREARWGGGFLGDTRMRAADMEAGVPELRAFYDQDLVQRVGARFNKEFVWYGYPQTLRDPRAAAA